MNKGESLASKEASYSKKATAPGEAGAVESLTPRRVLVSRHLLGHLGLGRAVSVSICVADRYGSG